MTDKQSEPRFTAEDFYGIINSHCNKIADAANAKLESWLGPQVYSMVDGEWDTTFQNADKWAARLFGVQEIEKKKCEHWVIGWANDNTARCVMCNAKVKATWTEI